MKIRTLSLLFIAALSTQAAWAAGGGGAPLPPQFSFDSGGVSISGGSVGEPIAWMGMIRERDHAHMAVRFVQGVDAADLSGNLTLVEPGADQAVAIYTAVVVGNGAASVVAAPAFISAIGSIDITAVVSADSISVAAPFMELLYVRPGVGSWTFGTGDGSDLDADGEENGSITVSLAQLVDSGAGLPPETVEAGDVVIAIDPYRIRVGQLAVAP